MWIAIESKWDKWIPHVDADAGADTYDRHTYYLAAAAALVVVEATEIEGEGTDGHMRWILATGSDARHQEM